MKGIVLAGGHATRLGPASRATSKQLMHVYNKPLIYYPLSTLIHARINEILIINTPAEGDKYINLLGDGSQWGCEFSYATQSEPRGLADAFVLGESFIGNEKVALILGDNIFYGWGLGEQLQRFTNPSGALVFGLWVPDPSHYGVLVFDGDGEVTSIVEKPVVPPSNFMVPGLYFYDNSVVERAKGLEPSARGEIEITDLNQQYLNEGNLEVVRLPFATDWFDVGSFDALLDAQNWVAGQERRKGLLIGSPETAAYREGFIGIDQLERLANSEAFSGDLAKSGYAERLLRILELEAMPGFE
ncbi:MAG: sugar phosphate nucleotidyltransferase [Acidimicrobiia bacterium]